MRYLVTGGTGFLGASVCKQLLDDGDEVVAYDLVPGNVLPWIVGEEVAGEITVRGDVTDGLHLLRTAKEQRVDGIIHLASLLGVAANADPSLAVRVNCGGMANVLETARILGLRRVVWASSISVYRGYRHGDRVPNDAPYRPINVYGGTKILNELLGEHYTRAFGVETIGFRLSLMLGTAKRYRASDQITAAMASKSVPTPRASLLPGFWRSITSELIDKPVQGLPGRVPYGDDVASWLWVDDAAHAFVLAARSGGTRTRSFNIDGDVRPIPEAVAIVRRLIPGADLEVLPGRHDLQPDLDTRPLAAELGFRLQWPLERQLQALIEQAQQSLATTGSYLTQP